MNDKSSPAQCSKCGESLPPDAPEGLCPRCLLALNLNPPTVAETGGTGPTGSPPASSDRKAPPGIAEIAPHFPQLEILECLGRGGMGVVYKARQPLLDRLVALKILTRDKEKDGHFAERFQREAQALARLNHPNIVTVYEFGESGGLYYLLMELVDGTNLRHLMQAATLTPTQALAIVPPICDALQFAHTQGIVHRDIKPENILIDKQGRVKIADFGIAKILGANDQREPLTGQQQVMGTPHYMAPEQVEHPATVDHRADIYSLGVVFYEMLTGELPLGRFALPSELVRIDLRLDEVVMRALEKEPDRRYQQASQVRTRVETIASGPGPAAAGAPPITEPRQPISPPLRGADGSRFSRWVAVTAAYEAIVIFSTFFITVGLVVRANQRLINTRQPLVAAMALLFLVAPAVVGTVAGLVGLVRVCRSRGKLRGAGLALAETVVFPLFALNIGLGLLLFALLQGMFGHEAAVVLTPFFAIVLAGLLDAAIIYAVWPLVKARSTVPGERVNPAASGTPRPPRATRNLWQVGLVILSMLVLLGLLVLGALVLSFRRGAAPDPGTFVEMPAPSLVNDGGAGSPAPGTPNVDPAKEVEIFPAAAPANNFFNLATGQFVTPPDAVVRFINQNHDWRAMLGDATGARQDVERVRALLRQAGVTLFEESANGLTLLDGVAVRGEVTPGQDPFADARTNALVILTGDVALPFPGAGNEVATLTADPLPTAGRFVWYFRTRAGIRGVLQFLRVDPNTEAVSIRYLLLQEDPVP